MSASESSRLFIAIAVPDAVKAELIQAQGELRELLGRSSAAWTAPEKLHLTLRFLGAVDVARLEELEEALRAATVRFGSLHLVCERLGCFPNLRFPRVLWAWVHDGGEQLPVLVEAMNAAVGPFAASTPEERFTGHVTLARPRRLDRMATIRLAEFLEASVERRFGEWQAREVELIRSELDRAGSRYTVLAKFPLGRDTAPS